MKLGKENHVYKLAEGWGSLPDDIQLGYTHGIVTDAQDHVYIFNMSSHAVIKFDREGTFLGSWGEQYAEGAHGMLLHKEGGEEFLYLTDVSRRLVEKTTLDGKVLLTISTPDLPEIYDEERKFVPTDVAVAPNGDIYVSDGYGQSYVHQFDSTGKLIRSWGGKGSDPGQLNCPHGVSIDTRGSEPLVYVADRGNKRIQIFTLDGKHIRFVTEEIDAVCSFFQYKDEIYLPDLNSRVTILNKDDKLITHLGEHDAYKQKGWPNLDKADLIPGKFNSPHGICVDSNGDIYLAEWIIYGRITKLIRQ